MDERFIISSSFTDVEQCKHYAALWAVKQGFGATFYQIVELHIPDQEYTKMREKYVVCATKKERDDFISINEKHKNQSSQLTSVPIFVYSEAKNTVLFSSENHHSKDSSPLESTKEKSVSPKNN